MIIIRFNTALALAEYDRLSPYILVLMIVLGFLVGVSL